MHSAADRIDGTLHGFPCLLILHPKSHAWVGYVAVPSSHPWHGLDSDDVPTRAAEVTYAGPAGTRISPAGAELDAWVLGFGLDHLRYEGREADVMLAKTTCEALASAAANAASDCPRGTAPCAS